MRRYLLASTAILALAVPAQAEDITNARTTPVRTSTIASGSPASIKITSAGSVTVTSGTAVTMDSNHAVTNEGNVKVSNANNAAGIVAVAGTTGDIVNSGTITVDEPYTPTDTDNDGDLDGPFALGANRFGIRTDGAHQGNVVNSGTITVEGNDSAGIWLGGPLTGNFTHNGTTTVLGDNSTAVHTGAISGNVRLAGTISAKGDDAVAAELLGDIGGTLVVQGNVSSTGYRATTAPSSTTKLDADDLLQGGPALVVGGNVAGGIVLAVAPKDANKDDPDEDKDGIPDASEGNAQVASYGAAPAMVIGAGDRDVAIGPVASTASKYGLQIDGTVRGSGVYAGVDANGLLIGGLGGNVSIANGISISGTVGATSKDANATALHFGAGSTTPVLQVSGTVEAAGSSTGTTQATAIQIDAGASLPIIRNSGTIKATAGENGNATAIIDKSGTLGLIENSGAITATGAKADSTRNIAIDLSANTAGAIVRQTQVGAGIAAPKITGDIRFGTGNDLLDVADGSIAGTTYFGAGNNQLKLSGDAVYNGTVKFGAGNDAMSLAGTSIFSGTVDFGGGADMLTIAGTSRLSGKFVNAANLAVDLDSGVLDLKGTNSFASLDVGDKGILAVTLDKGSAETTVYNITGTASFADGAKIGVKLADLDNVEGRYQVLTAGTLTGISDLEIDSSLIPFILKASIATGTPANTLAIDVAKRSATELGLNTSQAAAYNAIFASLGTDESIEKVILGINNGELFRATLQQLLPDHAGGTFEGLSVGLRTLARQTAERAGTAYAFGGVDVILNGAGWTSDKDLGETAAYDLTGMGATAAVEIDNETVGSFGLSLGWLWNDYDQGNDLNAVQSDVYELAAYWRGEWGGLTANARAGIGRADFSGRRTFLGMIGNDPVNKTSTSEWSGNVLSFLGGLAYEFGGEGLFFRPGVSVDYIKLSEDGHTGTGGGAGFDLIVEDRDSDELAVNGGLTVGMEFARSASSDRFTGSRSAASFRVEAEGGWREVVKGELGATTAKFANGTAFTLTPEQHGNGWYARLRAMGGGRMFQLGGEIGAEDRNDNTAISLRGTLRMGF